MLTVAPFGLTVAFKVAVVWETAVAALVATVGGLGSVVNESPRLLVEQGGIPAPQEYWT